MIGRGNIQKGLAVPIWDWCMRRACQTTGRRQSSTTINTGPVVFEGSAFSLCIELDPVSEEGCRILCLPGQFSDPLPPKVGLVKRGYDYCFSWRTDLVQGGSRLSGDSYAGQSGRPIVLWDLIERILVSGRGTTSNSRETCLFSRRRERTIARPVAALPVIIHKGSKVR